MPEIFILVLMEFQWPSLQIYWKFSHIKWKKLNDVNHILMWLSLTGSLFLLIIQFKELKQKFITDKIFNCVLTVLKNFRPLKKPNSLHFICLHTISYYLSLQKRRIQNRLYVKMFLNYVSNVIYILFYFSQKLLMKFS